jgi:hypothetical protein
MDIKTVVAEFSHRLQTLIEEHAVARARDAVLSVFGAHAKGAGGRPTKAPAKALATVARSAKTRKKPPRQLCPVPGCKNTAAPVFGMVCADHKGVAKATLKKYRAARKAKKLGSKVVAKRVPKKRAGKPPSQRKPAPSKRAPGARPPAKRPPSKRPPKASAPKAPVAKPPMSPPPAPKAPEGIS